MTSVFGMLITRGRQAYAAGALRCFLDQDYPNKQLIILDDADDRSFPASVDHPLVRYEIMKQRLSIPAKRNRASAMADANSAILLFDSDDWSAPNRMSAQMEHLTTTGMGMVGFHSILFFSEHETRAYRYSHGSANYAVGTSLCYWKTFWERYPFPEEVRLGSDNKMVYFARAHKQLSAVDGEQLLVARIHPGNSNKKQLGTNFKPLPLSALPAGFRQL